MALSLITSQAGCALLQLPFALLSAVIALVQIPIQVALGLVGPATKLAPAALLFVKRNPETKPGNLLALTGNPSESRQILSHEDLMRAPHEAILNQEALEVIVLLGENLAEKMLPYAQGSQVLSAYLINAPVCSSALEPWLREKNVRAHKAQI